MINETETIDLLYILFIFNVNQWLFNHIFYLNLGMPSVEVGLNDINRQGKEVVGRYDIIPVVTEEWIRLEDCEFHNCVEQDEFHKTRVIK